MSRSSELEPPPPGPHQREHRYIETLLRAAGSSGGLRVPPGDDAAVLDNGTVITADTMVEGVHFDDRLSAADVGWKVVAISVSDLAAMGARPAWMILCLSLPDDPDWVAGFADGLGRAAHAFGVPLIGGDTTGSPGPHIATITMGGACVGEPVARSGGSPGQLLWVTGTPGLAGAGYQLADPPAAALEALRHPEPPLPFALALAAEGLATAMMDLSDGLASDLPRLCAASGCGAEVDPTALPVPAAIADRADRLALQLAAGDDYELLFATEMPDRRAIEELAARCGVRVTPIGRLTDGHAVSLLGGMPWPSPGHVHFGEDP